MLEVVCTVSPKCGQEWYLLFSCNNSVEFSQESTVTKKTLEPRKKKLVLSIKNWLFNSDPENG